MACKALGTVAGTGPPPNHSPGQQLGNHNLVGLSCREMCSDGKLLCLVLRQAELSCTRVWTSPLCWGLLRSCVLAPSPFPLHTLPELLPPAHPISLPTCGHSGAPSAAVGQEKGKTHHVGHPSPWLAGWIMPAASHVAFLSVGLMLPSLELHLHLL